jgi:thiamine pyrophosphate-dependent acetolactate synthase large subunit-like protein
VPTVAERILVALHDAGSSTVFGLPGVHNLAFWAAEQQDGLPAIIKVRHEQTAVYAADGWSRATGRLGAALVTTGPGAANCVAAFGEAAMARSPVLLIASEVPTAIHALSLSRALHQSPDQAGMFRSLAKSVWTPRTASDAVAAVGMAVADATAHPSGPVYVDIPSDLLWEPAPEVERPTVAGPIFEGPGVATALTVIESSQSVGIWAGGGAVAAGAEDALIELAEKLHAPVFTTFASRGIVPPDHPCAVTLSAHEPELGELLAGLDLLIAIGSDFDGMLTKNASLDLPTIIDINLLAGQRGFGYDKVIPVIGDARMATEAIVAGVARRVSGPADDLRHRTNTVWARLKADARTEDACEFVEAITAAASEAIVINDMTIPGYWLGSYFAPTQPRRLQYPLGWGTLGYALPAAVGAGAARTRSVLVVCGDAGVMFALGELATLSEEDLAVTVLIVDDGGYGMLRFDQDHAGRSSVSMNLRSPDFVNLVRSFGVEVVDVGEGPKGLEAAIRSGLASKRPNAVICRMSLYPPRSTSPRWGEQA